MGAYDQVDPNSRLVAESLERRWNEKLKAAAEIKQRISVLEVTTAELCEQDRQSIILLGEDFSSVWNNSNGDITIKKKIVRCVIKEIVVDIDEENEQLNLIIHWDGGSHTALDVPRPMPACKANKTDEDDLEIIRKMSVRYDDTEIAKVLSKLGRKTGRGNNWHKHNVGTARRSLGIKAVKANNDEGLFNLAEATRYCGVSNSTMMRLINENILAANQIVQFAPFEIKKSDLDSEPVAGIIKALKKTGKLNLEGSVPAGQAELAL